MIHLAPLPRLRTRHCRRRTLNGYARREKPSKVSSFPIAPKQPRLFRAWKHFLMMEGVCFQHSFLRERERDSVDRRDVGKWFFFCCTSRLCLFLCRLSLSLPLPPLCGCQTKQKPLRIPRSILLFQPPAAVATRSPYSLLPFPPHQSRIFCR